jgi:hypothetical protein
MNENGHESMKPQGEKERFLDRQENVDRLLWGVTIVGVLLLLVDVVYHRHIYHSWEHLWGFYGIFGTVSIIVLVQLAKGLRKLVMRDEDHYESD